MLFGQLFALVGLAAGFFFFIFAAKYYGSILFVLIGKNKIENRLNWRNFNNHNGNNGNHNNINHNGLKTALNGGTAKTAHNGGTVKTAHNGGGASHFPESHLQGGAISFEFKWPFRRAGEFLWTIFPLWLRKTFGAFGEAFRSIMFSRLQLFGQGNNTINGSYSVNGNGSGNGNSNGNGNNKPAPFVSIHLAFYNEKNVADRILTACTSLDYPNYEVIVADDSIDETVEILEKWKTHPRVKVLHRAVRRGWKGGALNEALKQMDPKTEYVVVFDADFIPPSDIIQQFLPYFAIQGNGNGNNNHTNSNSHTTTAYNGNGNHNHLNNNHRTVNKNDYQRIIEKLELWYEQRELAVIQGYQWHYLNAGENWLTRGIRAEYSSSYVIERTCQQLAGSMKMISGSVFMIKAGVLKKHGWAPSMTEDWELTLRLYLDGYKVAYTPYIQAPAECPHTIPQLVKQRMRWAEGHTYNAKKYFWEVLRSKKISLTEKLEFIYYAPYYLQSFLFLIGTAFWFLSEAMHQYLPFWTQLFGWALLLSNLLSLPLMGLTGLFLEKNVRKDLTGIFSFIIMSYVLVPFQAYASLKGLLEAKERGTWIRTLKTGKITEVLRKLEFRRVWRELMPRRAKATKKVPVPAKTATNGGVHIENNPRLNHKLSLFNGSKKPVALILLLVMSTMISSAAILGTTLPQVKCQPLGDNTWTLDNVASGVWYYMYDLSTPGSGTTGTLTKNTNYYWYDGRTGSDQYITNPIPGGTTWTMTLYWASKASGAGSVTVVVYWSTSGFGTAPPGGNLIVSGSISLPTGTGAGSASTGAMSQGSNVNPSTPYHIVLMLTPSKDINIQTGSGYSNLVYSGTLVPENSIFLLLLVPLIPVFWANRKTKASSGAHAWQKNETEEESNGECGYFKSMGTVKGVTS